MAVCFWTEVFFLWGPNLQDEGDNFITETAGAPRAATPVTGSPPQLVDGDLHFDKAARSRGVDRRDDFPEPLPDKLPPSVAKGDDGDLALGEVLLVPEIPISREERIEARRFGRVEKLAVAKSIPSTGARFLNDMVVERRGNAPRRTVVKKRTRISARALRDCGR